MTISERKCFVISVLREEEAIIFPGFRSRGGGFQLGTERDVFNFAFSSYVYCFLV